MRRLAAIAATLAVVVGIAVGTFQVTAAAPFVYGCTPADLNNGGGASTVRLYNGSGATANITFKLLAHDGTNVSAPYGIATSFTQPPTTTKVITWTNVNADPDFANTVPLTVRIVSDQSIEATLSGIAVSNAIIPCQYLHP
jgi:hypothetical protein